MGSPTIRFRENSCYSLFTCAQRGPESNPRLCAHRHRFYQLRESPESYHDAVGMALAGGYEQRSIHPVELECRGFEFGRGAKVVLRRIDVVTGAETFHHLGGAVADAAVDYLNSRAGVAFE
jgi:hypothetical protein